MNALAKIPPESTSASSLAVRTPSRREKAAIVMKVLLQQGADPGISQLQDHHITQVSKIMGELGLISRQAVTDAVREFSTELSALGIAFDRGLDAALTAFEGHLDESAIRRIREMNDATPALHAWADLAEQPAEILSGLLGEQSPSVGATILQRLPPEKAAQVLNGMEDAQAVELLEAFAAAMHTPEAAADRIAISLSAAVREIESAGGEDNSPGRKIGAILDMARDSAQQKLLSMLAKNSPETANAVRENMFTFKDIAVRLPGNAVGKVVAALDGRTVALTLMGAQDRSPEVREFIEQNLSSRLGQQIKDEMQEIGEASDEELEAAMAEMVRTIRGLESADEITLNPRG